MSGAMDKLVREAREDLGTREVKAVDWEAVDSALFARIESERRAERARFEPPLSRGWTGVALLAAAAAVAAVIAGKGGEAPSPSARVAGAEPGAGQIVAIEGEGAVLVQGSPAAPGASLRLGDVIEARGAQATVERPGKLTLVIERGTRAVVTHVDGSLVVALEQGAVEAQVVPVASGEAFAVDVGSSRVAVHGTHLRVARAGEHVVVDLSEGVVALGEAPRVGSVVGVLVTAPAHAEFAAGHAPGSMTMTHDPSAVRAPVALGPRAGEAPAPAGAQEPESSGADSTSSHVAAAAAPGSAGSHLEPRAAQGAGLQAPPPPSNPEAAIAAAVRQCMAEHPRAENVTVVVSTVLHLDLGDDGAVRTARFDPPVAPDVNGCASPVIFKTRFPHGGDLALRVDFKN